MTDDERAAREQAVHYHELGAQRQQAGDVDEAMAYYQTSIDLFPTAEAHTCLGWVLAARGAWDAAINQCLQAIEHNPDLGNAYNDIGVYLIEQGKLDEAVPWLEKALAAPRYDCRHYPYYHLGRIWERKAQFMEARDAYQASVDADANWPPARTALHRVLGFLN